MNEIKIKVNSKPKKIHFNFHDRFGAKDAKAKHASKEKQYELLLDDEIEFIQVTFCSIFDVTKKTFEHIRNVIQILFISN
jgi:hypothetical protein